MARERLGREAMRCSAGSQISSTARPWRTMAAMGDPKITRARSTKQAEDSERVRRAATELGVKVPQGFRLTGLGEDGRHSAGCAGGAADFRVAAAICRRLDGVPLADCWTDPEPAGDEKPAWAPPDDWTDTEAVLAYLAERNKHPEWPQIYNSWGEVIGFMLGVGGNATWDGLKTLARRARAAASSELSREDALLIGGHALLREFVQLGLEPPNIQTLTCRADQLKSGGWNLLFYGQHMVVRVSVSVDEDVDSRSDVTILTCVHGIEGQ